MRPDGRDIVQIEISAIAKDGTLFLMPIPIFMLMSKAQALYWLLTMETPETPADIGPIKSAYSMVELC